MTDALASGVALLLRHGHVQAWDYGWSWFMRCVAIARRAEREERLARLIDLRLARFADEKTFKRCLDTL